MTQKIETNSCDEMYQGLSIMIIIQVFDFVTKDLFNYT